MIVVEKFASFISECGKYSELMCMPSPFLYNCLQPLCILYYIVDHKIIILTILTYRSPSCLANFPRHISYNSVRYHVFFQSSLETESW